MVRLDENDFKPVNIGKEGDIVFYNKNTKEVTFTDPNKLLYFNYGRFTFKKLFKKMLEGAAIGFVVSESPILIGYCIIKVKYGVLIGSALGAIKVYADSTKGRTREMYCTTNPNVIRDLDMKTS